MGERWFGTRTISSIHILGTYSLQRRPEQALDEAGRTVFVGVEQPRCPYRGLRQALTEAG